VTYQVTFPDGKIMNLPQSDVFHVRVFSFDGLNGLDPISYMRESLGEGIASDIQAGKQFAQGAKLSGVLSTDGVLKDDAYQRIRESWQATYGGTDNAYKVAILENGLKFGPISMTNEQAQFLDLRKYKRGEVAGLYRVPPHMIGDVDRSTSWGSGIEQQNIGYVMYCLMAYLTAIEARIRVNLIPEREQATKYAKFNVNALLRGDMKARGEFYTKQVQNGALSPNEIRELEDMNPREGGDVYLTPANMLINGKPANDGGNDGENETN
jgi:HK97 family phage portal protein